MELGIWVIIKWYMILSASFTITSLFTLHFPSWRLVEDWSRENGYDKPSKKLVITHTIAYMLVTALVFFPAVAIAVLINNKAAIQGYTKSIIRSIIDEKLM